MSVNVIVDVSPSLKGRVRGTLKVRCREGESDGDGEVDDDGSCTDNSVFRSSGSTNRLDIVCGGE